MACKREPSLQSNQIKNQANMKNRQLLIDLMKRAAAVVTAVAMLATSSGFTFAARPSAERRKSEHAVQRLRHIIVIYQENWSFDSLCGQFPGANGLQHGFDPLPQYDKATNYTSLIYQAPRPLTGFPLVPDPNFPSRPDGHLAWWADHNVRLPLAPFDFTNYISADEKTGDIVHRFYTEQLQIDNGALEPKKNGLAKFVTWSDNPGLVLSYVDATDLPEGKLAQQYTICDNFFHSAYGGSFLNHQFLVAASAPLWEQPIPSGLQSSWDPTTRTLSDANLTIDGKYAVNTTQGAQTPHP